MPSNVPELAISGGLIADEHFDAVAFGCSTGRRRMRSNGPIDSSLTQSTGAKPAHSSPCIAGGDPFDHDRLGRR